uniref:Uncharacterized protein n=1 Tax=Alexandrium monilatum TaxID=311494 RepID=A0A7S4PVN4_9DINO|eukprot:CAMPEP_0175638908 /NCGR_PEP_ID=MMETSP0097-20121207/3467_1 /TAXON_ID=311494 /ORGANISM="Alexandrium monilatum, Strain CCMP3105" /LENGTH=194 /DNA_ID=CAMNT_0016944627 /DNA_START=24 /DNA_END=608 /DNA_ORIENTATION=-
MARRLALAVCLPVLGLASSQVSSRGTFSDIQSSICNTVTLPGLCKNHESELVENSRYNLHDARSCRGQECCSASSCYALPLSGFQCDERRGPTTCVGAHFFPPSGGRCRCKYGSCSVAGICPPSQQTLYEEHDVTPVRPEDFTKQFALLGLGFATFLSLATMLMVRFRRRRLVRALDEALASPLESDHEAYPEE